MAINPHDDYESLAKLLYPSIEASGNVYYGQTRKLTMDEVFGKNELNFDSHVESFRVEDDSEQGWHYSSYFCWKLGPLRGSVEIAPIGDRSYITLDDFPGTASITELLEDGSSNVITTHARINNCTVFAVYKLDFIDKSNENNLYSGSYTTYCRDVSTEFTGLQLTHLLNPASTKVNYDLYDILNRNFYIKEHSGCHYLYIQLVNCYEHLLQSNIYKPLTFTANDSTSTLKLNFSDGSYKYKTSDSADWLEYVSGTQITLSEGEHVEFKCSSYTVITSFSFSNRTHFTFINGTFTVSGNVNSMISGNNFADLKDISACPYAFAGMFYDSGNKMFGFPTLPATKLSNSCYYEMFSYNSVLTQAPDLFATELAENCYQNMFRNCTSLKIAPKLPATVLEKDCYRGMFALCTNLKIAPKLPAKNLPAEESDSGCYWEMFNFSNKLQLIEINASSISGPNFTAWLSSNNGCAVIQKNATYSDNVAGIPVTQNKWTVKRFDTFDEDYRKARNGFCCIVNKYNNSYKEDYIVSSGADYDGNGRGYLTPYSIGNMEQHFDENNAHKMDTYNEDGSYNQEIWGYKSFNSPVKFRNGVYGENSCLIDSKLLITDDASVDETRLCTGQGSSKSYTNLFCDTDGTGRLCYSSLCAGDKDLNIAKNYFSYGADYTGSFVGALDYKNDVDIRMAELFSSSAFHDVTSWSRVESTVESQLSKVALTAHTHYSNTISTASVELEPLTSEQQATVPSGTYNSSIKFNVGNYEENSQIVTGSIITISAGKIILDGQVNLTSTVTDTVESARSLRATGLSTPLLTGIGTGTTSDPYYIQAGKSIVPSAQHNLGSSNNRWSYVYGTYANFTGTITASGMIYCNGGLSVTNGASITGVLSATGGASITNGLSVTGSTTLRNTTIGASNIASTLTVYGSTSLATTTVSGTFTASSTSSFGATITTRKIVPYTGSSYDIGESDKPYNFAYVNNVRTSYLFGNVDTTGVPDASYRPSVVLCGSSTGWSGCLVPTSDGYGYIGIPSKKFSEVNSLTVKANIISIPDAMQSSNITSKIGSSSYPFKEIYGDEIYGKIRRPQSASSVPVGSIFLAIVKYKEYSANASDTWGVGAIRTTTSTSDIQVYTAYSGYGSSSDSGWQGSGWISTRWLPSSKIYGKFVALSGANLYSRIQSVMLLMRIE